MNTKLIWQKIEKFIYRKDIRFSYLSRLGVYNLMSDEEYLKRKFKIVMGKELDLENPKTFNEKLQWLKVYNRNPEHSNLVDKYAVRECIEKTLGREYLIPLIGVWDNVDDINFAELPEQFVLKCTHNSGLGMCICKDKSKLDIEKVKAELRKGLKQNYYLSGREWPYKNVKPRIIAEQYMDDNGHVPVDYKITCFNGEPYKVMVCVDRDKDEPTKFYSFDWDWNLLRHNKWGREAKDNTVCKRPENLEKMYKIAKILSAGEPFVRVDLYDVNGQVYFGELTFFPDSGFDSNLSPEIDALYGSMLKL